MKILITGGAGFIGSHLADLLIYKGHEVIIYDLLDPQVHPNGKKPKYLNEETKFVLGDICNRSKLKEFVVESDIIFHLAASVGIAQSQYEISRYCNSIIQGTATLLDILVNEKSKIKRLFSLSSMTCYGEGSYKCKDCGNVRPLLRTYDQIKKYGYNPVCPFCYKKLIPKGISENDKLHTNSTYAIAKKSHEELIKSIANVYKIPSTIYRCFDVYGPRQYPYNPHAGVVAIFCGRAYNDLPIVIFEDGLQTRDFIYIDDVVRIFYENIFINQAEILKTINIGSGKGVSINEIAKKVAKISGKNIKIEINNKFRKGDIRHCNADTKSLASLIPSLSFTDLNIGLEKTYKWVSKAGSTKKDLFSDSINELNKRNLIQG